MNESQTKTKKVVRRTKEQIKVLDELFAKQVQSNVDILFGQFSPTLTAKMKDDKWEEIRLHQVEKGDTLLANKDGSYVQKTHWQNVRKRTVEKLDKLKVQTGSEPTDDDLTEVSCIFSTSMSLNLLD
jgi:hypothetical protein